MDKKIIVIILFARAFLVSFHQFYYRQTWLDLDDSHHETFLLLSSV